MERENNVNISRDSLCVCKNLSINFWDILGRGRKGVHAGHYFPSEGSVMRLMMGGASGVGASNAPPRIGVNVERDC
jgi:hypothetical protein